MQILEEVLSRLPDKTKISNSAFEGANIILYTKDKDFFINSNGVIKEIVNTIKKRVELRPDPSICMEMERAKKIIEDLIPKEAGHAETLFDAQRSIVIIQAEKPGLAIGKQGELLREIKKRILWVPVIQRIPAIRSKIIENIRYVLFENNDYRKKFLNKVGKRIYGESKRSNGQDWIRLSFLGAARQVGRSCLLLQTPESNVLLDCGVNVAAQGQDQYPILDAPEFKLEDLDAVLVSHPHLDHVGFVPWLYKMGYKGPVYMTAPTRDVGALLCLDAIGVTQKEANKVIYGSKDVKEMVKHTITLDFEEVTDVTPDIRITFYNAGHTLGSSVIHIHIGNGMHNLVYSGDYKFLRTQLLEPAVNRFPRVETLITESTYGAKEDILPSRKSCEDELLGTIKETISGGGKVLVPVLGVGRSQEIMLILENAIREGVLDKVPVYVQGMVWDVTAIHTAYPDYLNKNVRKSIFHKDHNPFLSDIFMRVVSKKEQDHVIDETGPCVILATSGMMTGGASVSYFRRLADNPKNAIIFVNWQGEGSLGRRIQNGDREVQVPGDSRMETAKVNMKVKLIAGLSGHAGRNELIRYVASCEPRPKKVIVIHGESSKCLELASYLHKSNRIETNAPKNLETIRLR
ncbi:MAG: beta-CASP ribonuclease aCPSF1 [Candidatus Woesearchaeota archaeon]